MSTQSTKPNRPKPKKAARPSGKKPAGPPSAKLPPGFSKKTKRRKKKKSNVEVHKANSDFLYDGIPQRLASEEDHFEVEQKEVLKHFGIYQQDDRDLRKELNGKHYYFFIRSKLPGGRLTADQYLVHDRLADEHGNGTLRITTRQGFQLHGVLKKDLKAHLQRMNEAMVTTLGACGDVVRNTMCCPAPTTDPVRQEIQALARVVAEHTTPQTPAYHDVWLKSYDEDEGQVETLKKIHDGKKEDVEPLYGKAYLPRKFKVGFAYPGDNCVDVYTHDVGLIAIEDEGELAGFNVLVGGGLGQTHNKPQTYPRLGDALGYVPKADVTALVEHIIGIQRDHGNRKDRKQARMKYLVDRWGLEKFHSELADRFGQRLAPARPMPDVELKLHHGWHEQGDGHYYLGLSVENGRIKDDGDLRLKSGLREIVQTFNPGVRLTPNHDVLLTDLEEAERSQVEALLKEHGIPLPGTLSNTEKYAMACPALPTCGLAIAESERVFPAIIDELETEIARLGLDDEKLAVRMTGCPNGCARPYVSDIGIVGRSLNQYTIYLGGRTDGTRLNTLYKDLVPLDELLPTVRPLLVLFKDRREGDESFGDFCHRLGMDTLKSLADEVEKR